MFFILHLTSICAFKYSSDMLSTWEDGKIAIHGIYILFILPAVFVYFAHQWNQETAEEYKNKTYSQNWFKKIMDKSCEGIIILKDKDIEYMNDKFID